MLRWLAILLVAAQRMVLPGQGPQPQQSGQSLVSRAQSYLIPYDPSVIGQWNATDLLNGTSRVGAAWTKIGSPTFSYANGATPAGWSNFSDSNYFSLPAGASNPMSPASPFTLVVIGSQSTFPNTGPTLVGAGNFGATGYELTTTTPSGFLRFVNDAASLQLFTANGVLGNVITAFMCGVAGGTNYVQMNNGAMATASGAFSQNTTIAVTLGRNTPNNFPFPGTIYEVQVRKQAPSAALFTAIYQAVQANL